MDKLEQDFLNACRIHDLTYDYSDDPSAWRAGRASYANIVTMSKQLPRERAVSIWNSVVDAKLTPEAAPQFYWR